MATSKYKHNLKLDIEKGADTSDDLLDIYPELAAYEEFRLFKGKTLNQYIKYVFYAYDNGSGFVQKVKDLSKRKEQAALEAGFVQNKRGEWELDRVYSMIAMQDAEVNAMITRFLRSFVQNLKFEMWLSGREMIAQLLEEIRTPIDKSEIKDDAVQRANQTRMNYFKDIPALIKQVEDMEQTLFGNDNALKESVLEQAEQVNMGAVEKMLSEYSG